MKKYSKAWVLQDTINFYTLENRAVDCFGSCQYLTKSGKRCAIGRFLKKGYEKDLIDCNAPAKKLIFITQFQTIIPSWMKKTNLSFLTEIQTLHDNPGCWTNTGLSNRGLAIVKNICEEHKIKFESLTIKQ